MKGEPSDAPGKAGRESGDEFPAEEILWVEVVLVVYFDICRD